MLSRQQVLHQSQVIHPRWTARDHAAYLATEHPDGMRGLSLQDIRVWLGRNQANADRIRTQVALAGAPDSVGR